MLFIDVLKVYFYVVDDIEYFIIIEFFLKIVVSIVGCIVDEIKVIGL